MEETMKVLGEQMKLRMCLQGRVVNLSWSDGEWIFTRMDSMGNKKMEDVRVRPGHVEMSQLGFLADYLQSRLWWEGTPAPKRSLTFIQQENCLIFRWRRRGKRCELRLQFQPAGAAGGMALARIRSSITVFLQPAVWPASS